MSKYRKIEEDEIGFHRVPSSSHRDPQSQESPDQVTNFESDFVDSLPGIPHSPQRISKLPAEILQIIFGYLDISSMENCRLVNNYWMTLVNSLMTRYFVHLEQFQEGCAVLIKDQSLSRPSQIHHELLTDFSAKLRNNSQQTVSLWLHSENSNLSCPSIKNFLLTHGHLIKIFTCIGNNNSPNIDPATQITGALLLREILVHLVNVKYLEIDPRVISSIRTAQPEMVVNRRFRQLKYLTFSHGNLKPYNMNHHFNSYCWSLLQDILRMAVNLQGIFNLPEKYLKRTKKQLVKSYYYQETECTNVLRDDNETFVANMDSLQQIHLFWQDRNSKTYSMESLNLSIKSHLWTLSIIDNLIKETFTKLLQMNWKTVKFIQLQNLDIFDPLTCPLLEQLTTIQLTNCHLTVASKSNQDENKQPEEPILLLQEILPKLTCIKMVDAKLNQSQQILQIFEPFRFHDIYKQIDQLELTAVVDRRYHGTLETLETLGQIFDRIKILCVKIPDWFNMTAIMGKLIRAWPLLEKLEINLPIPFSSNSQLSLDDQKTFELDSIMTGFVPQDCKKFYNDEWGQNLDNFIDGSTQPKDDHVKHLRIRPSIFSMELLKTVKFKLRCDIRDDSSQKLIQRQGSIQPSSSEQKKLFSWLTKVYCLEMKPDLEVILQFVGSNWLWNRRIVFLESLTSVVENVTIQH